MIKAELNGSASLADLRKKTPNVKQSVVAMQMSINESAVSKMERKNIADSSISKVKRYIEAIGGQITMTITLADGSTINL
jgi:predicted XRE-type DNA-binding protein